MLWLRFYIPAQVVKTFNEIFRTKSKSHFLRDC